LIQLDGMKTRVCLVEIKTRTTHDVKPAEAAVDREKRRDVLAVAREYLRHMPWRLEVVSVSTSQQDSRRSKCSGTFLPRGKIP
jgi:Holliday junction resolvase-like predicted endonuclease